MANDKFLPLGGDLSATYAASRVNFNGRSGIPRNGDNLMRQPARKNPPGRHLKRYTGRWRYVIAEDAMVTWILVGALSVCLLADYGRPFIAAFVNLCPVGMTILFVQRFYVFPCKYSVCRGVAAAIINATILLG